MSSNIHFKVSSSQIIKILSRDEDKDNTWVYSKKDTRDIHKDWWSLVNSMARSAYVALYKAVMNINEDACWHHGWHGLEGNWWLKRDTPTDISTKSV